MDFLGNLNLESNLMLFYFMDPIIFLYSNYKTFQMELILLTLLKYFLQNFCFLINVFMFQLNHYVIL